MKNTTWEVFTYELPNKILTNTEIIKAITQFNSEIFNTLPDTQYLLIIFKIKTEDNITRSISTLQRVNKYSGLSLKDVFIEYWNLKIDNYNQFLVEEIIFNYKFVNLDDNTSSIIKRPTTQKRERVNLLRVGVYNFPQTMDLYDWGDVDFILNDTEAIVYRRGSSGIYYIKFDNHKMRVDYKLGNRSLVTFTDELLDINNLGTFKRTIKNQVIHFVNGVLSYKEKHYIYPKITKLNPEPFLVNKFITMDIETLNTNGVLSPYAISYYDGKKEVSFYLTDYSDSKSMLIDCIKSLMLRKYHGYKIYLHNLGNFDGIFLLNILTELSDRVSPIINNGKIISIKFKFCNGKYTLHLRDSFLLLPSSLSKLATQFNVQEKGIFPYNFVQLNNLNYEGPVPEFKYFSNLTEIQYTKYCKQFKYTPWNMKLETNKYCLQDCRTLYLVLSKFFEQNFLDTRVNGSKYHSLSALALANFLTHFLKDDTFIPNIRGEVFEFIKESYTGGAVDAYIPYGKKVYYYDVNSLYPYIMSNNPMPVGSPTYIEGSSNTIESIIKDKNKFSFIEVEVNCPDNIKVPLLLTRINDKTVAPTGTPK